MSSCLLLRFVSSQCSAVTCPTGTRSKCVGNNTKLVCSSGRQSVIVANHTSIASSILNPLDGLPRFPSRLWRRRDPRRYHHVLQGGGHHHHHLHSHLRHQRGMGERIVYRPDPEARKTVLGEEGWIRSTWPRPPCLLDRLRPFCVQFIAVHVVDDVGVHRAVPVVGAGLRVRAVQSTCMAQTPCPVSRVKALCPLPRQLCMFSEERDELCHDLWMELFRRKCWFLTASKKMGYGVSGSSTPSAPSSQSSKNSSSGYYNDSCLGGSTMGGSGLFESFFSLYNLSLSIPTT
jgi:hypothetical protein